MPNYGFMCLNCEEEFEKNIPMAKRQEPQECPICQKTDTKRMYHPFALNVPSEQDVKAKKAGLNVDRHHAVKEARQKMAKEGQSTAWNPEMSKLAGLPESKKIEGQHKVSGNTTLNLKG